MQARDETPEVGERQELRCFLLLTCVAAPVLAVAIVSGYGFLVWMVQLIGGPPAAP